MLENVPRKSAYKMIQKLLQKARKDEEVLAVILFGSYARGEASPLSDVDVCLVLHSKTVDRLRMAQKGLDYLAEFPHLDIQIFQLLPLAIQKRVLKEGKVLYSRNDEALYDIAYSTVKAFKDFRYKYYDYLEEVGRGS